MCHLSFIEDDDVICTSLCLVQLVCCKDDGTASLGELTKEATNHCATIDVDACRRLIEEDNVGLACHREGERKSLFFAARKGSPRASLQTGEPNFLDQSEVIHDVVVQRTIVTDGFPYSGTRIDATSLQHDAHPPGECRAVTKWMHAEHLDLTLKRRAITLARLDARRLAGTIRADDRSDGTLVGHERCVIDCTDRPSASGIFHHEVANFECGQVGHPLHSTHPEREDTHR